VKASRQQAALGLIGGGVMGSALARGVVGSAVLAGAELLVYDADSSRAEALAKELKCKVAESNQEVVAASEAVLLAVKPQVAAGVLAPLQELWRSGQLLISIMAGVPVARLQELTRQDLAVARVMPNVLATVGAAASAVAYSERVRARQKKFVERLLGAVGTVVVVEERLLDAVTGLSGSGPAFVALVIEALADGGVAAGLPRDQALQLAAQTVLGAGKYVLDTGELPEALKDRVCSPGGTTITGVRLLEAGGLRSALIEAVVAAARRSEELGRG